MSVKSKIIHYTFSSPFKLKLDPCFAGQCPPVSDSPISWVRDPCITWPEWRSQNRRAGTHYITHYRHRQGTVGGSNEASSAQAQTAKCHQAQAHDISDHWQLIEELWLEHVSISRVVIIQRLLKHTSLVPRAKQARQACVLCPEIWRVFPRFWPGCPLLARSSSDGKIWHELTLTRWTRPRPAQCSPHSSLSSR